MNRRSFLGTLLGGVVAAVAPKPVVRWKSRLWTSTPSATVIHFSDPFGVRQVVVKWGIAAADHVNDGTIRHEYLGLPR